MMAIGRVPTSFGQSYTVPILKTTVNVYSKSVGAYPSMTSVAYQLVQLYQKFLNTAFLTDMVGFSSPVITSSDLRRSPAVRMLSIQCC